MTTSATIGAPIVANSFLESVVDELKKAVSHAYVRGRFQAYMGEDASLNSRGKVPLKMT